MIKFFNKLLYFTFVICLLIAVFSLSAFAAEYQLFIGNVQVTDENAADVLGDGSVSYDTNTNTLTLNNANISDICTEAYYTACNIYFCNDLNIELVGTNRLSCFPEESHVDIYTVGIKGLGNLVINSAEQAELIIEAGTAMRENFGFYMPGSGLTVKGKTKIDITLADILITDSFPNVNDTYGNSICIHCDQDAEFYDETSLNLKTGNIFVPDGLGFEPSLENINSGGASVGIAVYGNLVFDTCGELYVNVGDSDGKRAGVASFSNFELKQGNIVVEMAPSKSEYLLAGPAIYLSLTDDCPCIPLCGTNDEQLITGKASSVNLGGYPLKYYTDETYSLPVYTMLVTSVVGIPEIETNSTGESIVTLPVEDEEKTKEALVIFSAYNASGRMTDIKFKNGSEAVNGKLDAALDLSQASCAMIFVFESAATMRPLAHKLVITDFT